MARIFVSFLVLLDKSKVIILIIWIFVLFLKIILYTDVINVTSFIVIISVFGFCHFIFRFIIYLKLTLKIVWQGSPILFCYLQITFFIILFFPLGRVGSYTLFFYSFSSYAKHSNYHSIKLINIIICPLDISKNVGVLESISLPILSCLLL